MSYEIAQGNALNLPLVDESVDLIVTSPPYFALRSYRDGGEHYDGQIGSEPTPSDFLDALIAATAEMRRVLKPSGSIFVNLGDKYAGSNGQSGGPSQLAGATYDPNGGRSKKAKRGGYVPTSSIRTKSLMGLPWRYAIRCIDELNLILRAELVWEKPNGLPESVTDRVRRNHEQWFMFTKEPRYYSAIDHIREPHTGKFGHDPDRPNLNSSSGTNHRSMARDESLFNPLGRLPGSVWTVPTEPLIGIPDHLPQHFAAFPQEWPRRLILGWSPPDGTVLDPFAGTGTVPGVAHALGRHGIGVDLSHDYCRLAEWRIAESGHFEKSYQRAAGEGHALPLTPPPTSVIGQSNLWEDVNE